VAETADWQAIAEQAAASWPGVAADAQALQRAAARVDAEPVHPDLLLAELAVRGNEAAIATLHRLIDAVVPVALARSRVPSSWRDEVGQRLRTRLLVAEDGQPHLLRYAGRGPLRAWLKVAALRTGLDLLRRQGKEQTLQDAVVGAAVDDPELEYLRRHYADRFKAALEAALAELPAKDRRLLKLRVLDELNIDEIGALHGVHRATAARWLEAAREGLGRGVRERLEAELAVDREQLDSILRLIRSRLDLSLHRRLAE
jgi:RNA polymerase sigma-70 factor (ECF subfamily)